MNSKVLMSIMGVVVIGVGAAYFMTRGGETPKAEEVVQGEITGTSTGQPTLQSMRDLVAGGQAQQCTFSDANGDTSTDGKIYFSAGKMRGDFDSTTGGQTTKAHMIVDGQMSHAWVEGAKTGFQVDQDKKLDFRCSSWSPDSAMFTVPK